MSDLHKAAARLQEIKPDYTWNGDVFTQGDLRADAVRCIIDRRLSTVDRTIILLYIDCQSYRELGRLLGFSQTTAFKEVKRVRQRILDIYKGKA
ncbi:helix-turn-helix domain-containing protein [Succinimonas sp.]|uniref:helix-turn-helix domain-containing protein n=1 Tax=Succinimonas sp. TaxID=1936151 RepID=UPI003869FB20